MSCNSILDGTLKLVKEIFKEVKPGLSSYADEPIEVMYEPRHEKTFFGVCKNKGTDQLHNKCAADQGLSFGYI